MAKVLYVIHRFWPYMGGAERHFFELARRTAALGHTVSVFATDAWDIEHLNHAGRKRIERLREQTAPMALSVSTAILPSTLWASTHSRSWLYVVAGDYTATV